METIDLSDKLNLKVLWAALYAMHDIHAPQDNMSEEEWGRAEHLLYRLDNLVNLT